MTESVLHPIHQAFIDRIAQACKADDRVLAAFLGGSNARGNADRYSDIDLCIITTDKTYAEFFNQRETFLRSLGELVFLESFDIPNLAFFIFGDGTEGELYFSSESRLDHIYSGQFRLLLDKKGILTGKAFLEHEADRARQLEELRRSIFWFWHEMSHFITALGRGQLWWGRGQLGQLRSICVNLARLQNDFSDDGVGQEPYFKIEGSIDPAKLRPLEPTFVPLEKDAMLRAVQVILQFYLDAAPPLAKTHGFRYPQALERVMLRRLKELME